MIKKSDTPWTRFRADRARYSRWAWLTEHSLWAVAVFRLGQATLESSTPLRLLLLPVYGVLVQVVRIATSIEIPRSIDIGPGFKIHHRGPVILNAKRIGCNCDVNTGVILGKRSRDDDDIPVLGDNVKIGAYGLVLGSVVVGDNAFVGAMTLVMEDVPPGMSAAGIPARYFARKARS